MKTVVITGASRGIGAAAARRFSAAGYAVALNYCRSEEAARRLAAELMEKGGCVLPVKADVSRREEVEALFAVVERELGMPEVLVNNAGVAQTGLLTECTDAMWETVRGVALDGTFYCCRRVLPGMLRRRHGVILNVSSVWGVTGASCEAAYSAAKAGIIGLTKALAKEVGPSGVRVNAVTPGLIDTDMNRSLTAADTVTLCEEIPLGRMGTPDEVAQVLLFLAGDRASYLTGQVLGIDGGWVL